ncbi:hypothetical protein CTAYLR_001167 [Chrysophaeum taylorii]|uniref:Ubiquitin carboxyl-terminal hydrolase n=1 Tax=Chrysophaeum taylorii TaxID=2483200 RepID=A0AAD7XS35_9STRA|nr:hypothetical protein CTAYLR_001167 [Chrysophaeum taylorii]
MSWCTVESDPGVFTELVEKFGVSGVEFCELYSLEDEDFSRVAPVYGLIFLFKWTGESDDRETSEAPAGVFFAKQMVHNACATQAILSVLLNTDLALGETLEELRSFSAELPPDMRGLAIENSEAIRTAHNSFSRPEAFVSAEGPATKDDDVFHFVAFVPRNGRVYELDGLKDGPVDLGPADDWLAVARMAINSRIEKYAASEIKFNLMAIVRDRRLLLDEKAALCASDPDELANVEADRALETAKREQWTQENIRRRHNYVPLVVDFLKVLAANAKLKTLVDNALAAKAATPSANPLSSSS